MLSRQQCFLCLLVMQKIGRSDIDGVHRFVFEHFVKIGVYIRASVRIPEFLSLFNGPGIHGRKFYAVCFLHIIKNVVNDKSGADGSKSHFLHFPNLL